MFNWGDFISSAGETLPFKIECDDLTDKDWDTLARIVASRISYKRAIGVPRGGLKFAEALNRYRNKDSMLIIICDDVLTTGKSMQKYYEQYSHLPIIGIVVFARRECSAWIKPIFKYENI